MMLYTHPWFAVLIFTICISMYLLYLFFKDKDKRKLMFILAFLISCIFFILILLGYYTLGSEDNERIIANIASFSALPILFAVFFAVHEDIFKIKNFDTVFYVFIILTTIFGLLVFLPYELFIITTPIMQIVSIEVLLMSLYLFLKTKSLENLYFVLFIISLIAASGSFRIDTLLPSFSFLTAYIFLTLVLIQPLLLNTSGKKMGIKKYFSVEQQLKNLEEKYKKLFESIPDAISVLSEDGNILDCNPKMAELFNKTKEEIIGKNMQEVLTQNLADNRTQIALQAFETGTIQTLTDEQDNRYFSNIFIPIKSDNDKKNLIILSRDVTENTLLEKETKQKIKELKDTELATLNIMEDMQETVENLETVRQEILDKNTKLEMMNTELSVAREQLALLNMDLENKVKERTSEVELLLKQKDEFIGQLGHDLKTPLTPLNTLLPIIRKRIQDPKCIELLDASITSVNHMKKLVTKTLQLARLSSPHCILNLEDVFLAAEIGSVLDLYQHQHIEKNITVQCDIDESIIVRADVLQLKEVVDNLISNAFKYTPSGGTITIETTIDHCTVTTTISDTGSGLTEEQLSHIFEEFYKADTARHDLDSTGLGLAICKRIIEKHGGRIVGKSSGLGKGSSFSFTLPIKEK